MRGAVIKLIEYIQKKVQNSTCAEMDPELENILGRGKGLMEDNLIDLMGSVEEAYEDAGKYNDLNK